MDTLTRMKNADITQVDMIRALRQRKCIIVQPAEMSNILNGVLTTPKAQRVLKECELILDDFETAS